MKKGRKRKILCKGQAVLPLPPLIAPLRPQGGRQLNETEKKHTAVTRGKTHHEIHPKWHSGGKGKNPQKEPNIQGTDANGLGNVKKHFSFGGSAGKATKKKKKKAQQCLMRRQKTKRSKSRRRKKKKATQGKKRVIQTGRSHPLHKKKHDLQNQGGGNTVRSKLARCDGVFLRTHKPQRGNTKKRGSVTPPGITPPMQEGTLRQAKKEKSQTLRRHQKKPPSTDLALLITTEGVRPGRKASKPLMYSRNDKNRVAEK